MPFGCGGYEMLGHNHGPELAYAFPHSEGFVAISRRVRLHELVGFGMPVAPAERDRGAYSRFEAFCDLIMECRYAAGKVINGGKEMLLQPGQLLGAVSWLANRWNWTPKTVRLFLDRLEAEGMIERGTDDAPTRGKQKGEQKGNQKGKQAAIITICKYREFQTVPTMKGQTQGQTQGQTKGQQAKQKKEDNNLGLYTTPREEQPLPKGNFWAEAMRPKGEQPEAWLSKTGAIQLRKDIREAIKLETKFSDEQITAACRQASGNVNGKRSAADLLSTVQRAIGYMQGDALRRAGKSVPVAQSGRDEISDDFKRQLERARQQDREWGVYDANPH